jgi:RNA recognition motif-containing protein
MFNRIFIGGIPYNTTEEEIAFFLAGYRIIRILLNRGFAIVDFVYEKETVHAVVNLHNTRFKKNSTMKVSVQFSKTILTDY